MYARKLRSNTPKWNLVLQRGKYSSGSNCREYSSYSSPSCTQTARNCIFRGNLIGRCVLDHIYASRVASERLYPRLHGSSPVSWRSGLYRFYSSEGDGRNASEDKHANVKDGAANPEKGKIQKGKKIKDDARPSDAHARLGEEDQKEWLNNERLAIESKKKESPFMPRQERYKNEFLRRIVPWEKITVSWDTFPYYIQ